MATIHIKREHHLHHQQLRDEIQGLAEQLSDELAAAYCWEEERLIFKRSGADGCITIGDSEVDIEIRLGLALTPFKKKIEQSLNRYLDERLG
jgi:putative polyhydroxyalkanoate system protein